MRNRKRTFFTLSTVIFSILLFFGLTASHATTVEQYIETGETQLFSGTVSGVIDAYVTFGTARGEYPNDPVINAYLAITRLLDLGLKDGDDTSGLRYLMEQYGFTMTGDNFGEITLTDPVTGDGDIILPETAPSGETLRAFLSGQFMTAINASIANLDITANQWNDTSKHIILKENFGFDPEAIYDIEMDYGDIYLFRSVLTAMKALALIITAYDIDVDLREIAALSNMDVTFDPNVLLARYGDSLKLLPTATTAAGNGALQLSNAKTTLIDAINDYLTTSGILRNEDDPQAGAEELVEIDECELLEEEWYRNSLTALRDSLTNTTVFQLVEREETWEFTDSPSGDTINLYFEHNMSEGSFESYDLSLWGGIECVVIDGSQISVELSGWNFEATFEGTYNSGLGTITDGTYSGTASGEPISGDFTGERTDWEEEITTFNLNPLFGSGSGPYDLRNLLPEFNCCGEPIDGTAGHGLGDDPTLGGIIPGMTHDMWDFDDTPCPAEAIVIPTVVNGAIDVTNGDIINNWSGIAPVYEDATGDKKVGENDPNPSGADIENLYIAKDSTYYYFRMTLADGPPGTATIDPFGATVHYSVQFLEEPDNWDSTQAYFVAYEWGEWAVRVSGYPVVTSGDAQAVGNDIEWRVPVERVLSESGKYLAAWTDVPYGIPDIDGIGTCNIMGPTASVSGAVTLPIEYDGTDPVFIGIYRWDPVHQTMIGNRIGGFIIYPGEYQEYTIYNLPVSGDGEWFILVSLWDVDFNGIQNRGDYMTNSVPFQTTAGVNDDKDLSGYTEQTDNDFPIEGSVMHVNVPDDSSHTYLEVCIGEDFPGIIPDDVDSITITGPNGFSETMDYSNYEGDGSCYFANLEGEPDLGTYTFTVVSGPFSAVTTDTQTINRIIPIPDGLSPEYGAVFSPGAGIDFSWNAVEYNGIQLYYRLEVADSLENRLGATPRTADMLTSSLPPDTFSSGETYLWRVRVSDSESYLDVENRSQTEWQSFSVTHLVDAIDILGILTGMEPAISYSDVDGDSKIGLAEVAYILQGVAGLRTYIEPYTYVSIEGHVYVYETSNPISGAIVSTSLDGVTATTDSNGHFFLQTETVANYATTPYTITISATGYATFSGEHSWGDHPVGQVFYLSY